MRGQIESSDNKWLDFNKDQFIENFSKAQITNNALRDHRANKESRKLNTALDSLFD